MQFKKLSLLAAISLSVALGLMFSSAAVAQQAPVARGKYLVNHLSHCLSCHSPIGRKGRRVPGLEMSGVPAKNADKRKGPPQNVGFPGPFGMRSYPSNLTPDKETGIGNWTEADWLNAFRKRVNPQGKKYAHTQMEWDVYRNIKDADLKAIFAYLRTMKPVKNKAPTNIAPKFPGKGGKGKH